MTGWHGLGKQDDKKAPSPPHAGIQDLPGGHHPVPGQCQVSLETAKDDKMYCCIYTSEV